ncbi:MAG: AAA family ATPase [Natronosporangium sp.]
MLAKPEHVFDRDADWQAVVSFATDPRPQATLGVVSGRRRQGKTYLLSALAERLGGFYFEAVEATEAESLRMFGAALAGHAGAPAPYAFASWDQALSVLFALGRDRPTPVILDEFPYLMKASPALPSMVQREIDTHGPGRRSANQLRLLVCGSAMSVMGRLLSGTAPLRGRAGLELVVQPLDPGQAATFWGITDPRLAVLVHAIVGGTPAYRREFVRDDTPDGQADFDAWVERTVLNPRTPLFREARYLLAEEADVRDPALYHSALAAIADGNSTRGGIANYIGRKAADISHPLSVLEECALVVREPDAFRTGRTRYRIAEPLVVFYQAIMRPQWRRLELGQAGAVWRDSQQRFGAQVVGPHFEALCRDHALRVGGTRFGSEPAEVLAGTVADPAGRTQIEVDVVVLGPATGGQRQQILALGEAKWGHALDRRHLDRLRRARDLLAVKGYDTRSAVLVGYGGAGANPEWAAGAGPDRVQLVDLDQLYATG